MASLQLLLDIGPRAAARCLIVAAGNERTLIGSCVKSVLAATITRAGVQAMDDHRLFGG